MRMCPRMCQPVISDGSFYIYIYTNSHVEDVNSKKCYSYKASKFCNLNCNKKL